MRFIGLNGQHTGRPVLAPESDPIFVTEFGSFNCNPWYAQQLIDYADQWGLSWSAWAWFPGGCGFPAMIDDWSGTPSATGQIVRTALGNSPWDALMANSRSAGSPMPIK